MDLYDEAGADAIVAQVLAKCKSKKENHKMSIALFRDKNGKIKQIVEAEEVTREALNEGLVIAQAEVERYSKALETYDALVGQNVADAESKVEDAQAVAAVPPSEQPVQDPPAAPAEEPVAPVEQQPVPEPAPTPADQELKPVPIVMG